MSVRTRNITPSKKPSTCTWEELGRHSGADDCWVAVDGKVYDVTGWLPNHPGGKDMLLMASGRDITNLFESYHPLTNKPWQILQKYYVCDISNSELPKYTTKSPFYDTLRTRINSYFKEHDADPQKSWRIYARIIFVYLALFATYYLTHFVSFKSIVFPIIFAVLFGVTEALFAMHTLHDSCHASITHSPSVWRWLGCSFDVLLGASFFSWIHQHVMGHHIYTNVRGADPDLGESDMDFRRISPFQKWHSFHKFQHLYAPFLYGLLAFKYRVQDFFIIISGLNGRIRITNIPTFYLCAFLIGKVTFVISRLVVPLFFMPLGQAMLIFLIAELVMGYYLAINFQVSHVATGLDFLATPSPPEPVVDINEDWAILQVKTTQDYGHNSFLTAFFSGGLNYQVVHHLFPTISQTYYPQIAPIVSKTCQEYGIKYQVLPSFWAAFCSHVSHLKEMGKPPAKSE